MGWPIHVVDYVATTVECGHCPDWRPGHLSHDQAERLAREHYRLHDEAWERYNVAIEAGQLPSELPDPFVVGSAS